MKVVEKRVKRLFDGSDEETFIAELELEDGMDPYYVFASMGETTYVAVTKTSNYDAMENGESLDSEDILEEYSDEEDIDGSEFFPYIRTVITMINNFME